MAQPVGNGKNVGFRKFIPQTVHNGLVPVVHDGRVKIIDSVVPIGLRCGVPRSREIHWGQGYPDHDIRIVLQGIIDPCFVPRNGFIRVVPGGHREEIDVSLIQHRLDQFARLGC